MWKEYKLILSFGKITCQAKAQVDLFASLIMHSLPLILLRL
ncbi:hypothetical protein SAMN04487969_101491 [Paenibacillus algorifonticola]|uniref:Uncharacterized protein n=1 Tax=Paenibacillus algorifonticola TaxID=684063 RepID=A0A1I1YEC5_9BACL|nr:hypothetical protein SAMN04487969_101491 [Paenibacillus algorifonticola]